MKSIKLIIIGITLFLASAVQGHVKDTVNIGTPPAWGLIGYSDVRYYFLPDLETYYDVHTSMFIYNKRGQWVHNAKLPKQFRDYDLYSIYKVAIKDYVGETPFTYFKVHRTKYAVGNTLVNNRNR